MHAHILIGTLAAVTLGAFFVLHTGRTSLDKLTTVDQRPIVQKLLNPVSYFLLPFPFLLLHHAHLVVSDLFFDMANVVY